MAQLENHTPLRINKLRLQIKFVCSMLHRAIMVAVQMGAELSNPIAILVFDAVQKGLRVGAFFSPHDEKCKRRFSRLVARFNFLMSRGGTFLAALAINVEEAYEPGQGKTLHQ